MSLVGNVVREVGHDIGGDAEKIIDKIERTPRHATKLIQSIAAKAGIRIPGLTVGKTGAVRPVGHPAAAMQASYGSCSTVDPRTGTVAPGESFTYSSRLQLTGAQAINTDLGDFFTTAASSDLVTNNQFPFTWDVEEASLTVGVTYSTAIVATGTELSSLLAMKLIERKYNSQEQYQLTVQELAPFCYYNGVLGTPTATAPAGVSAVFDIDPSQLFVQWGRHYESTEQWQLVLRTPRAFTVPANATLDLTLNLRGRRI